jgi:ferredoxin-type protein NapH
MANRIEDLAKEAIEKKGWFQTYKWLLARRIVQLGILGLFMAGPWAGVWVLKGNLSSSLLFNTVPMTDPLLFLQMLVAGFTTVAGTAVIGAALVLVFYLIVGGRVYCSWVCPVNIVTDFAKWLRRRLKIKATAHIHEQARYWMLAMVLILSLATGSLAYELVNPVSMLHRGIIFGMGAGWGVVLAVFLFDLLIMKHGWCGHLCPMGAFYSLVGNTSLIRVRADNRAACDNCMECYVVCPEPHVLPAALKGEEKGTPPVVLSGDCTNCGRCIDICAEDVFAFGLRSRTFREGGEKLDAVKGQMS